jgi:hypothetical protein
VNDQAEFFSGTDPVDPQSYLKLLSVGPGQDGGVLLSWASAVGKLYTILQTTNLIAPDWQVLRSDLPATPPVNTFTVTNAVDTGSEFYCIRLQ